MITCLPSQNENCNWLTADVVEKELVLDDNVHYAPTRLICLENTMNGELFPLSEQQKISQLAKKHGISMHLDGARIWNAMVATKTPLKELCDPFDSVSLCFSKGLGAPVGSVLVGSFDFIKKARHFRKLYGGGMRQAGLLAAACLYCLEHHLPNLGKDHENASYLAKSLQNLGLRITKKTDTNMVWVDFADFQLTADDICAELLEHGVKIFSGKGSELRLVLHHQIRREEIDKTLEIIELLLHKK